MAALPPPPNRPVRAATVVKAVTGVRQEQVSPQALPQPFRVHGAFPAHPRPLLANLQKPKNAEAPAKAATGVRHVQVFGNLGGGYLHFSLHDSQATVVDLKEKIACSQWGVPSCCQQLVGMASHEILLDWEIVEKDACQLLVRLPEDEAEAWVAVNEVVDQARNTPSSMAANVLGAALRHRSDEVKHEALDGLQHLVSPQAKSSAAVEVTRCLESRDVELRPEMFSILADLAGSCKPPAVSAARAAVMQHTGHQQELICCAARLALFRLEMGQTMHNTALSLQLLQDPIDSRMCMYETLRAGAVGVAQQVVDRIVERMWDAEASEKWAAIRALAKVGRGDAHTLALVIAGLQDQRGAKRETALQALAEIAQRGDQKVVDQMRACLSDSNQSVVVTALKALSRTAEASDPHVNAAITRLAKDQDPVIRQVASRVRAESCIDT